MTSDGLYEQRNERALPIVFRNNENPRSYRTVFTFQNYMTVIKRYPSSEKLPAFSIKFFKNDDDFSATFERWTTNVPVDDVREMDAELKLATGHFSVFLGDMGIDNQDNVLPFHHAD